MEEKNITKLEINNLGNVGSIVSNYIESYITEDDMKKINNKINILNNRLDDFDIFKYKIINRIKIKSLLVKVISEDNDKFIDIACDLLRDSEENFENIVDSFMKLSNNDIDTLYYNLWKKRNNPKFDIISLKKEIENNFEFFPDLIMSFAYRVNKENFKNDEKCLILGDTLTLMPGLESSNIFNVFEKLAFNNFIKLGKYVPDKTRDSFNTYICFKFTYLGIYLCRIMEKYEKYN